MRRWCVVSGLFVVALAAGQAAEAPLQGIHTSMTVKVPQFADAQAALQKWAIDNGLRMSSTAMASTQKGRKHGWVKLVVPTDKLDPTLAQLATLGKVVESRRWSDDLGWQKMEASARLTRVKDHGDRLQSLLQGRNLRVRDKMYLYDRLFQNGADQDALSRDLVSIESQAQQATVNVTLFEPYLPTEGAPSATGPRKTLADLRTQLMNISADAVSWFVQTLMKALVYSPIWIPAVIIGRRYLAKYRKGVVKPQT